MENKKPYNLPEVVKIIKDLKKEHSKFIDKEQTSERTWEAQTNRINGFYKVIHYFEFIADNLTKQEVIKDIKLVEKNILLTESQLSYTYRDHNVECQSKNLLDILRVYKKRIDREIEEHSKTYEEWKKIRDYKQLLENITCDEETICEIKFEGVTIKEIPSIENSDQYPKILNIQKTIEEYNKKMDKILRDGYDKNLSREEDNLLIKEYNKYSHEVRELQNEQEGILKKFYEK